MRKKLDEHDKFVVEQLKDPEFAAEYLNEHWSYRGTERVQLLLDALHKVALAQGMSKLAKDSGVSRRNLYKAFSGSGNPKIETLIALLDAVGVSIQFRTTSTPRSRRTASTRRTKSAA